MALQDIKHVFVLMLENRSFDHVLGFSGISGINGLNRNANFNSDPSDGIPIYAQTVNPPAYRLSSADGDPGHELYNTFRQLTGQKIANNSFPQSGYSAIPLTNKGFVMDYALYAKSQNPEKAMYCFSPEQVPVITTLAKEFAVCDCWYSSLPGPAVPNQFFFHAGTSGSLDTSLDILSETIDFFSPVTFKNGTIFKLIDELADTPGNSDLEWHIYKDGFLALSELLEDVRQKSSNIHNLSDLALNLTKYNGKRTYNFIEPDYSIVSNYKSGNSQHPYGDIRQGELLIKNVYETIRNNEAVWRNSLLIILYDEHGGFYDHAVPPRAIPVNDISPQLKNTYGFKFDIYGVRVPAVFVSPWIPKGTLLKEFPLPVAKNYDHTSVIRSLCEIWGMPPLTPRDRNAQSFLHLISNKFRDVPANLLENTAANVPAPPPVTMTTISGQPDDNEPLDGMLQTFMRIATMNELARINMPPERRAAEAQQILSGIKTKLQGRQFLQFMHERAISLSGE